MAKLTNFSEKNALIRFRRGQRRFPPGGLPNPMPCGKFLRDDPKIRKKLHLDVSKTVLKDFQKKIPIYALPRRPENERTPIKDTFARHPGNNPRVEEYIKNRKGLLGTAGGRKQEIRRVLYVKDEDWAHIVESDQSACFISAETGEVQAYVIRNCIGDKGILKTFNETSKDHCKLAKDIRDGELGQMCSFGYSAGPRQNQEFMIVSNLERLSRDTDQEKRLHTHRLLSAHTLIWNKAKRYLPASVIHPLEEEMDKMPRGDWASFGKPFEPVFPFKTRGRDHELTGLDCGPASGLCASVYARGCHFEHAPKEAPFVIPLTTAYDIPCGGNFYIQDIGLLIKASVDTIFVHRADVLRSTTVPDMDFAAEDSGHNHRGFRDNLEASIGSCNLDAAMSDELINEEDFDNPDGENWDAEYTVVKKKYVDEDEDVKVEIRTGLRQRKSRTTYSGFEDEDRIEEEIVTIKN